MFVYIFENITAVCLHLKKSYMHAMLHVFLQFSKSQLFFTPFVNVYKCHQIHWVGQITKINDFILVTLCRVGLGNKYSNIRIKIKSGIWIKLLKYLKIWMPKKPKFCQPYVFVVSMESFLVDVFICSINITF